MTPKQSTNNPKGSCIGEGGGGWGLSGGVYVDMNFIEW